MIAGGVGVEAAKDFGRLGDESAVPRRVGSDAGGRDAAPLGGRAKPLMASMADLQRTTAGRESGGKGVEVLAVQREPGAKPRQDCSLVPRSSAPTGTHVLSREQESGVRLGVGVEGAGTDGALAPCGSPLRRSSLRLCVADLRLSRRANR